MTGPTEETSDHDTDANHDRRSDGSSVTGRDRTGYQPNPDRRGRWLSAVVGVVGLWLVAAGALLQSDPAAVWNDGLVGGSLFVAGAYNFYRQSNREFGSVGVAMFVAILGLWEILSPFMVGVTAAPVEAEVGAWNAVLVGLLSLGLGGYGAVSVRNRRREADARPTATYDRRGQ